MKTDLGGLFIGAVVGFVLLSMALLVLSHTASSTVIQPGTPFYSGRQSFKQGLEGAIALIIAVPTVGLGIVVLLRSSR